VSYLAIAGIVVFAGASFLFALAESALFSLGKWRVMQLAENFPGAGRQVNLLLRAPHDLLATIVLGNTFANAGIVATALWLGLAGQWPLSITIPGVLMLILVGCEIIPKTLAVRSPERWSLRVAGPLVFAQRISAPLRMVAQEVNGFILGALVPKHLKPQTGLSDEEYQELIELACQQGTLAPSEKEIILEIIQLDQRTAGDVMKPRPQMAVIPDDFSIERMREAARHHRHRRLPIYDETPDTIVGILNTRELLLNPGADLEDVVEFPSFVPESMNLLQLFKSLQRQQRGLAVVLDEFGSTAGLVTMEDILEEVVGELHSEGEKEPFMMERLGPGKWRVNAAMRIEDFQREHPALREPPEIDTMGGLLMDQLGIVPAPGESAVCNGVRLTALSGDERRLHELLVEDLSQEGAR
jgi:putative hemolysin